MSSQDKSVKNKGLVSEIKVLQHLVSLGWYVAQMAGQPPYDIIAENPSSHKIFRIQVKSANIRERDGAYRASLQRCGRPKGRSRPLYKEDDFDFHAIVYDEGILYIPWPNERWEEERKWITLSDEVIAEFSSPPE